MTQKNSNLVASFFDSIGSGILSGKHHGNKLLTFTDTIPLLTTDLDAGDIIGLIPVKSSDSIKSIKLFHDDLDSNGTPALAVDIGLYAIDSSGALTATGGDVDVYADGATELQSAGTSGTELAFKTRNITLINNEVWQDLGESADTKVNYVLAITVATVAATQAAGDLTYKIEIAR